MPGHQPILGKPGKVSLGLGAVAGLLVLLSRRRHSTIPYSRLGGRPATALITGASSGIGAEFARQLAAQGYDLVLVARREERLRALAAELEQRYSISAQVLVADLSNPVDVSRVEKQIAELEHLDLLINNAGFGMPGRFAKTDRDKHLEMIQVHVIASVRLCRAALPGMIARNRGALINVSSLAAFFPMAGNTTYSATKAYLNILSESLQIELIRTGVRVQVLCPGFTHTEFHSRPGYGEAAIESKIPGILWMSADQVVSESLSALGRDGVICIPGLLNRLIALLARSGLASVLWMMLVRRFGK